MVVVKKDSVMDTGHGNNTIPTNGVVLSGHGTACIYLNRSVSVGDTLRLLFKLQPARGIFKEMIGGGPRMIVNGQKDIPNTTFCTDRHPRTALGFNQDSTKVFFFVVDGRQPGYSVGMSLFELADYMLEWGVFQGMNLDGGGSTTMVVRNAVKNRPSDAGGERAVANALLLISHAPTSSLNHLRIEPREIYTLPLQQTQFNYQAFDEFWNPISITGITPTWSCSPLLGTISNGGLFTAAQDTGSDFVFLTLGDIRDSVLVHVTDVARIVIKPNPVVLKVDESQQMTAQAFDGFNNVMTVPNNAFTWSVIGDIGPITAEGLFTATKTGSGWIKATYRAVSDSVSVAVGSVSSVTLDAFNNLSPWSLSGTLVDLPQCGLSLNNNRFTSPPTSARLKYALSGSGTSALYLNCSIPISGTPDAVSLWVYGDGRGHWLRGEFSDKDNELFLVDFTPASPGINWTDNWQYLEVSLKNAVPKWSNPSAVLTFPITWKKIYLAETNSAKKDTGSIYLDDFVAHYTNVGLKDESQSNLANAFSLLGIFPNPFNNYTNLQLQIWQAGYLEIYFYDLTGKEIDYLAINVNNTTRQIITWRPQNFASGLYFFRVKLNDQIAYGKCLMLK